MRQSKSSTHPRRKSITFLPVANDNLADDCMQPDQNELFLKKLVAEATAELERKMDAMLVAAQAHRPKPANDNLWDLDDVAAYLNVAKKTLQNHLVPKPDFPAPLRFLGRSPRWNPSDIKRWAERSRGR